MTYAVISEYEDEVDNDQSGKSMIRSCNCIQSDDNDPSGYHLLHTAGAQCCYLKMTWKARASWLAR